VSEIIDEIATGLKPLAMTVKTAAAELDINF